MISCITTTSTLAAETVECTITTRLAIRWKFHACWVWLWCTTLTTFYLGQDLCFNNTFVLGGPRRAPTNVSSSQWADLRGCDLSGAPHCQVEQNPYGGGEAPIMVVRHNTVYNHNQSAGDVQCSAKLLSLEEFKVKCGYDGGTSSARLPSTTEIIGWAKRLLGLPL
eukprot:COSAG05_NODE_3604_length_1964_cov_48.856300_1_plen_166_part_00